MSDSPSTVRLQDLLEHSQWVRELARRLARDADAAEDLAQKTWLAALQHPPAAGRPLREWLGTVVRNFARQARRGESRRGDRERAVARAEALPSTADLLERASLQREVVDAVMGLAEPYRTTILLRFFESLPPREIAQRLAIPVETVRTRLTRGLEKLRVLLDEAHGGERRTWVALLAPLADRWVAPSPIVGTALMNAKLVASLTVVSALGLGAWWIQRGEAPLLEAEVVAAPTALAEPQRRETVPATLAPAGLGEERVEVEPAASAPAPAAEAAPAAQAAALQAPLSGRVVGADGRPVSGVELEVAEAGGSREPGPAGETGPAGGLDLTARSDGAGRFTLEHPPVGGRLEVAASARMHWTTVMGAHFGPRRRTSEAVVVIAPRAGFSGTVVDEQGRPLEGARVAVELPTEFRSSIDAVLDGSKLRDWQTTTDADGRFDLEEVPGVDGARCIASLGEYETFEQPAPQSLGEDLLIRLTRPSEGLVRGLVVDASGRPIEGAQVALGVDCRETAADGSFVFELDDPESMSARFGFPLDALTAVFPGFLPARYEPASDGGELHWPSSVTLILQDEPFGLEGRVTDHLGEAMANAQVWVADTTFLGAIDGRPAQVESYLAGSDRGWSFVDTDEQGLFLIQGLLDREYTLRAMDEETMLIEEFGPFQAGAANLELRLQTDRVYPRVAGQVLSHAGRPVPGARVFPMCDAFQARARGRIIGTTHSTLEGVITDGEGRFELRSVPRSLVYLRIQGETILPLEYGRYVEGDPRFLNTAVRELPEDEIERLEIAVEQRCHLRVRLNDPAAADELSVLDPAGQLLTLNLLDATGRQEGTGMALLGGRSETLAVSDTGQVLVLFLEGEEVGRLPIELTPGEVTEVTF